jgi:hypothetical protein
VLPQRMRARGRRTLRTAAVLAGCVLSWA